MHLERDTQIIVYKDKTHVNLEIRQEGRQYLGEELEIEKAAEIQGSN